MEDLEPAKIAAMALADQGKAWYNENIDRALDGYSFLMSNLEVDRIEITAMFAMMLYADPEYTRMILTSELAVAIDRLHQQATEIEELRERLDGPQE